jgi:hypothetical protein
LELTEGLLVGAVLGLTVYCLVDSVQSAPCRVRGIPVWSWYLVILLPLVGSIAWLALGRPRAGHRRDDDRAATRHRLPRRTLRWTGPTRAGHATAGSLPTNWQPWPVESLEPLESLEQVGLLPRVVGPEDDPSFIAELARQLEQRHHHDGDHD